MRVSLENVSKYVFSHMSQSDSADDLQKRLGKDWTVREWADNPPDVYWVVKLVVDRSIAFASQNPHGKSTEAEMVRNGTVEHNSIMWTFRWFGSDRREWLSKIVDGVFTAISEPLKIINVPATVYREVARYVLSTHH